MSVTRGADLLISAMQQDSVEVLFTLSGNQIMPLFDASLDAEIRLVHSRHEAASVFMADGYAQASGKIGVALVTAGPGFANALGALYSCQMSETPVILLSGDSPTHLDGMGAFQEMSQCDAARPFVKHTERVSTADQLATAWQQAVEIAMQGRPGPVHLSIPFDVLNAEVQPLAQNHAAAPPSQPPQSTAVASEISDIVAALALAKRPLALLGPAAWRRLSAASHRQLETTLQCPVIGMISPRGLKDPSLGRFSDCLQAADTVLLLDKKVDFTLGFGRAETLAGTRFLVVDAEASEVERSRAQLGSTCTHALAMPFDTTCEQLQAAARGCSIPERGHWIGRCTEWLNTPPLDPQPQQAQLHSGTNGLWPGELCQRVQHAIAGCKNALVICDGGEFGQWAQAMVTTDCRIINGPSGAIGGSLPAAIGAALARPDMTIFALLGDGTAGFHLSEFETAAREQAAFIAIIGNDSTWNAEHQIQVRDYGAERTHNCMLAPDVRYQEAATALGACGYSASNLTELETALTTSLQQTQQAQRCCCINVQMRGLPAPAFK